MKRSAPSNNTSAIDHGEKWAQKKEPSLLVWALLWSTTPSRRQGSMQQRWHLVMAIREMESTWRWVDAWRAGCSATCSQGNSSRHHHLTHKSWLPCPQNSRLLTDKGAYISTFHWQLEVS